MTDMTTREKKIMNWTWGNILNAALIISAYGVVELRLLLCRQHAAIAQGLRCCRYTTG